MAERVRLTDVAPRDGLQNEAGVIETDRKLRLIELLAESGVDEIEATSFVSPKWIPQLADASDLMRAVSERFTGERHLPTFSVLVPNDKGFERAARFHTPEFPLKIAVFTAASETFSRRNTNATIDETIERFRAFVPRALDMGMAVRMYVSCAIKCPFEGDVAPPQVRSVCDRLLDLAGEDAATTGKAELDLGDTIGAGTSDSVAALIDQFDRQESTRLVLHLHDTFGRATECVRTGLDMGVRSFDGSAGGLGGCPYAGTKQRPAPGNIAMATLVRTIENAGYKTLIDHTALEKASVFARRIVDEARAEEAGAES